MKHATWIRGLLLAGVLCTAFGAAHAQSRILRHHARVVPAPAAIRPAQQLQVADAVWNFVTGAVKAAWTKAFTEVPRVTRAPAVDERIFDI